MIELPSDMKNFELDFNSNENLTIHKPTDQPKTTEYIPMADPDAYFSDQQIELMYDAIINKLRWSTRLKDRNSLFLLTLQRTGGRVSEVLQITPEDIKEDGINMIVLKKKILVKQKTAVKFDLIQGMIEFENMYDIKTTDRYFPFTRQNADDIIKKIAYAAGIFKVGKHKPHCHLFRHTLAVNLSKNRAPLAMIQRILKHSSPKITAHYQQFNIADQKEYLDKLR